MQLSDTITDLKSKESDLRQELLDIARHVKTAQSTKAQSRVKQLLVSSVAKRNNLTLTSKKRLALEQQLDAIATTQLNQQVLTSMKQTSSALKSMGLNSTLDTVDEVMSDMQEASADIGEITQSLSTNFSLDQMDDDALQAELALLMGDEVDGIVEAPITVNSIKSEVKLVAPVQVPATKTEPVEDIKERVAVSELAN